MAIFSTSLIFLCEYYFIFLQKRTQETIQIQSHNLTDTKSFLQNKNSLSIRIQIEKKNTLDVDPNLQFLKPVNDEQDRCFLDPVQDLHWIQRIIPR